MKNTFYSNFTLLSILFVLFTNCSSSDNKSVDNANSTTSPNELASDVGSEKEELKPNKPSDFLPEGYKIVEEIYGDFNKDGTKDCILIIKGTDKKKFVEDEYQGKLDRNRRGILALINNNGHYELAVKNEDCFSSENEDGGVYFAPELSVELKKGILELHYAHGRYGFWSYKFRFRNGGFELIGFDLSSDHGPLVLEETSINFLTKKKLTRKNLNEDTEAPDNFEETWETIKIKKLIQLSEIEDFDEFDESDMIVE